MPLTEKGKEIKQAMTEQYGEKKGEQVFYASKNKGTITGVDSARLDSILAKCDEFDKRQPRDQGGQWTSGGGGMKTHKAEEKPKPYKQEKGEARESFERHQQRVRSTTPGTQEQRARQQERGAVVNRGRGEQFRQQDYRERVYQARMAQLRGKK
jgi:hypothetical protein